MYNRSAESFFDGIAEQQAWDASSQIQVLLDYIADQKDLEKFEAYLLSRAAEENGEPIE